MDAVALFKADKRSRFDSSRRQIRVRSLLSSAAVWWRINVVNLFASLHLLTSPRASESLKSERCVNLAPEKNIKVKTNAESLVRKVAENIEHTVLLKLKDGGVVQQLCS